MRAASIPFGLADTGDTPDRGAGAAPRFHSLARGEQLTLWSVRAIALGHAECPALRRALQVALGSAAEEAFTSLFVAVRTLGWCARRRLRLHVPGCDGVSEDERRLLAVFAAAQSALLSGDEGEVRRLLDALIEPPLTDGFLMTLQVVASALEVNGYPPPSHREAAAPDRRRLH